MLGDKVMDYSPEYIQAEVDMMEFEIENNGCPEGPEEDSDTWCCNVPPDEAGLCPVCREHIT
jgi:hypothetical protein